MNGHQREDPAESTSKQSSEWLSASLCEVLKVILIHRGRGILILYIHTQNKNGPYTQYEISLACTLFFLEYSPGFSFGRRSLSGLCENSDSAPLPVRLDHSGSTLAVFGWRM